MLDFIFISRFMFGKMDLNQHLFEVLKYQKLFHLHTFMSYSNLNHLKEALIFVSKHFDNFNYFNHALF